MKLANFTPLANDSTIRAMPSGAGVPEQAQHQVDLEAAGGPGHRVDDRGGDEAPPAMAVERGQRAIQVPQAALEALGAAHADADALGDAAEQPPAAAQRAAGLHQREAADREHLHHQQPGHDRQQPALRRRREGRGGQEAQGEEDHLAGHHGGLVGDHRDEAVEQGEPRAAAGRP